MPGTAVRKPSVSGYVLAGGRSSRMGADKAALPYQGGTLGEFVAGQVLEAAGDVTVVGGAAPEGIRRIPDLFPGFGPAGGILTALEDAAADWSLIVACDMPGLTSGWLLHLLEAAEPPLTLPRTPDGRLHPLCAVWHRSALSPMRRAVGNGIHTMREAIRDMPYKTIPVEDPSVVANVNTPADWARFTDALRRAGE